MKTKRIEYAYPTSLNAKRFGFGRSGCYTVDLVKNCVSGAIAGFATSQEAWDYAVALPEPWDKLTRDREGSSPLDQVPPIPDRARPRLQAAVTRLRDTPVAHCSPEVAAAFDLDKLARVAPHLVKIDMPNSVMFEESQSKTSAIPCDCGQTTGVRWYGPDDGRREYLCPACYRSKSH